MKIRNFSHYERHIDGKFKDLELHIITTDKNRHRIEGVTEVKFVNSAGESTNRQEVFSLLAVAMKEGYEVRLEVDEPLMFRMTLVVRTFDKGDFFFYGVGK